MPICKEAKQFTLHHLGHRGNFREIIRDLKRSRNKCAMTRSGQESGSKNKGRKYAFTLAEVLITLGIIGIVAALTLPTLVANYREKQRVTQIKKTYSVLSQAFQAAVAKYGDAAHWDLKITSDGSKDENDKYITDYSGTKLLLAYLAENLNTQPNEADLIYTYYSLDGTLIQNNYTKKSGEYLKLSDGTIILGGWVNNDGHYPYNADIVAYYPGCEKKGCKVGQDLFYFKILLEEGKIIPTGSPNYSETKIQPMQQFCNINTNSKENGRNCTAWVIQNENMDYLHCSDLSWDGKTKCK